MKCSNNPIKDPVKPLLLKPLSLKLSCTHELLGGPPGTHPWPGRKVNHHHLFNRTISPHAAPAEIKLTDVVRKGVNHAAPHDLHHLGQTWDHQHLWDHNLHLHLLSILLCCLLPQLHPCTSLCQSEENVRSLTSRCLRQLHLMSDSSCLVVMGVASACGLDRSSK